MKGSDLNLEGTVQKFKMKYILGQYDSSAVGNDMLTKYFPVKKLPKICFEMYEGGKEGAMKRRIQLRNEDPKRIEAKRKAALMEKKMEMERKRQKLEELRAKKAAEGGKAETEEAFDEVYEDDDDDQEMGGGDVGEGEGGGMEGALLENALDATTSSKNQVTAVEENNVEVLERAGYKGRETVENEEREVYFGIGKVPRWRCSVSRNGKTDVKVS